MSTHDYQPSRYEVASGRHSPHGLLLSPASQPPNWANYDAQTLASSLPSVHSLPPLSAALAPQGGRGRSLSEAANTRHASCNTRQGPLHDRHRSLAVPPQGARSGLNSSFTTTAGPADIEAPHRRTAIGDRRPVNAPSFSAGVPHLPAPSRHYSPTQAPFYEAGRAMSPMPVAHPGGSAHRQLHAGAGSWSGQRPDAHDRPSSGSNESANSPLYHRQESSVHTTPLHSSSHTPSPRLYGRPVGRAHHVGQVSPSLQGHRSVSYAGTTGRLRPSRSSSSLKGTQSSEETVTEDKSAGRYECEYCSKRFNRPSSLKVQSSTSLYSLDTERVPQIHVNKHTGAQRGCFSLYGPSRAVVDCNLVSSSQHFNVPFQTAVVASVSCQTCVAMHESIQMPWSIRRRKEKVPTRPVPRAPIPTLPVKRRHFRVAQDGELVSSAGTRPVVGVPVLSLGRALRMILIWKWPRKKGRRLQHSHLPSPVDPHIVSRSRTFHPMVRLLFPIWDLSIRLYL